MSSKKWLIIFFSIIIALILISAILIIVVDPYFHYHEPLSFLEYKLDNGSERYINNGIIKNFNYDAIITGTSITENFKTSTFNSLFNCNSIKVSLRGAEFKEIADQTMVAINSNKNLKYILYGITYEDLLDDKDEIWNEELPTYLYDEDIFNDYKYIFSGQALKSAFTDIIYTIKGNKLSFDEYARWGNNTIFSKEAVLSEYERTKNKVASTKLNQEEKERVIGNINQNIINVVKSNENITFYLFLTPHSIVWWDDASQNGTLLKYLEAEEILINSLLECNNVKLYSFFNNYDLICNLDEYVDKIHYSENVNSQILQWIRNDEYLITKENVNDYLKKEKEFYLNYNYDSIFINN